MSAGDADLERQPVNAEAMVLAAAHAVETCIQEAMPSRASQMRCFYERVREADLHRHLRGAIQPDVDRLRAQLAAQQAVVDAAREVWGTEASMSVRSAWRDAHRRLGVALAALDAAQAAQPEGERA